MALPTSPTDLLHPIPSVSRPDAQHAVQALDPDSLASSPRPRDPQLAGVTSPRQPTVHPRRRRSVGRRHWQRLLRWPTDGRVIHDHLWPRIPRYQRYGGSLDAAGAVDGGCPGRACAWLWAVADDSAYVRAAVGVA